MLRNSDNNERNNTIDWVIAIMFITAGIIGLFIWFNKLK